MANRILTRLDPEQAEHYYGAGLWERSSLYSCFAQAAQLAPERAAFVERCRRTTYAELSDAVDRLAGHLRRGGLSSGARVGIWMPSRVEVAAAALACSREGFICVPSLHRDHTVSQVVDLLARIGAAAFIGQAGYGADGDRRDVLEALQDSESLRVRLSLEPAGDGVGIFDALDDADRDGASSFAGAHADAAVYLAFTSGSTGQPKGVLHTSNTLLAPIRAMSRDWKLDAGSILYSMSPLSHNLGFGAMLMALCTGGTLVAHDLPKGASLAQRLLETQAQFAFGVPTHAIDLVHELESDAVPGLPELVGFRVSGASISADVAQRLIAQGVTPQSGYGMTEAGNFHYTRPFDDTALVTGSSGRPFAGHAVRIVDREDVRREMPRGDVGQILARGPSITVGYFDDQLATEEAFTEDGWLMTGDLGWVDEADNVRITGRKKDVIIRGGHNIFPARIENLAGSVPGVARAAAIPVPDERLGEKVCLVIAWTGGDDFDAPTFLQQLDAAGLSKYDMPEYVALVPEIPLLPSGKLNKLSLLEQLDNGRLEISPVRFSPTA